MVLTWIPKPVLNMLRFSTKTFSTPPDVSLPTANPPKGEEPVTRRMVMPELGRPKAMPYSSQPLFIEIKSSPVEMKQSSMQTLELESANCVGIDKLISRSED